MAFHGSSEFTGEGSPRGDVHQESSSSTMRGFHIAGQG